MTRNIDELNNIRSVDPRKYFEEMGFTEEEIEERLEFTEKANSIFDLILVIILLSADRDEAFYKGLQNDLETQYLSLINDYAEPDDYLIQYAMDFSENFVGATKDHIDEEWYTSADRSLFNAENSANDVLNYEEYKKAVAEGKTKKKWITEKDSKVRRTHREVDGKTIGIKEKFNVGGVEMRFPKDYEYAEAFPQETVNCRCRVKYL